MSSIQIPNLPEAASLTGEEQLEIVQSGTSARTTVQSIADFASTIEADMDPYTVKANVTALTAQPQDVTTSAVLDMISSTQGSILYRDVSQWVALAPSTSGYILQTDGPAANPSWVFKGYTVSSTAPPSPSVGDVWIDIS